VVSGLGDEGARRVSELEGEEGVVKGRVRVACSCSLEKNVFVWRVRVR